MDHPKMPLAEYAKIQRYCLSVNSLGTNKEVMQGYLTHVYGPLIDHLRIRSVIELGIWTGYSLMLWRDYMNLENCVGIDNNTENLKLGEFNNDRIKIITADAFNRKTHKLLESNFDLIIDDANHTMYQQSRFATKYIKKLNPLGAIVIEDIDSIKSRVPNIIYSIPPYISFSAFLVDTSGIPGKLSNSKCVVIQIPGEGNAKIFEFNEFWHKIPTPGLFLRILRYPLIRFILTPYRRISTSVTYRIKKLLRRPA